MAYVFCNITVYWDERENCWRAIFRKDGWSSAAWDDDPSQAAQKTMRAGLKMWARNRLDSMNEPHLAILMGKFRPNQPEEK